MSTRLLKNLGMVFFALFFVMAGTQVLFAGGYAKQKVVYHINSNNFLIIGGALRNIQNHINAVGEDKLDLIVVVHGGGHVMFRKDKSNDEIFAKIKSLKMQGVKFRQCATTLRRKKLDVKKDLKMISEKELVPSGVAEIAKLEQEGYVYIKP